MIPFLRNPHLSIFLDLSAVEGEPMPALARPLAWEQVEAWLAASVRELGAAHLGVAT